MEAHTTLAGSRIGDYQVERMLRSGGMATLFLAHRVGAAGFTRQTAIKVIHPHMCQDPSAIRMFIDEARICSRIVHPNVVHVEELGEEGGQFYLVMEYVEGCSASQLLSALARRGIRLPTHVAVHIAIGVAEGLHAAHEACDSEGSPLGVVHRDVSPSNVLLSTAGHVKIIDFGIAKARNRLGVTESRCLKGKLRYMSPEQASGDEIDRRTDIYSLGVVLWELCAGEPAFVADDDFALLAMVRQPNLRSLRDIRDDVPTELEMAIRAATAANPKHRPADAYEFARLLRRACPNAVQVDHHQLGTLIREIFDSEAKARKHPVPMMGHPADPADPGPRGSGAKLPPEPIEMLSPDCLVTMYDEQDERAASESSGVDGAAADWSAVTRWREELIRWMSGHRRVVAGFVVAATLVVGMLLSRPGRREPSPSLPSSPPRPVSTAVVETGPQVAPATVVAHPSADESARTSSTVRAVHAQKPRRAVPMRSRKRRPPRRSHPARVTRHAPVPKPEPEPEKRPEPAVEPEPVHERPALELDGVTIATQPDEEPSGSSPRRSRGSAGPSRVGNTSIAESFDQ